MKLDKICRTCLCQKDDLKCLFKACIPNMIMSLTSVRVVQGDGLPQQICLQCLRDVNRAFSFKQKCEKSEATLRNYLSSVNDLNQICSMPDTTALLPQLPSCSVVSNGTNFGLDIATSLDNNPFMNNINEVKNDFCDLQHSSFFQEIFNEPIDNQNNTVVSDFAETMQSLQTIAEQYLPESWENDNQICPIKGEDTSNSFLLENMYKCQFCGESFNDSWQLDEHTKSQVCQGKYFSTNITNELTKSMLLEYTFDTNSKDNFMFDNIEPINQIVFCDICDRSFTDQKYLKKHRKDIHFMDTTSVQEVKKNICTLCGKRYKNSKILKLHMRTHTGERPLKCEICSRTFALPSSLMKHYRIHKEEKPYECNICGKRFNQQSNVNAHILVHSGEKPHGCTTCGKRFATNTNLEIHKRIHSGVKPFVCTFCDKGFIASTQLKKHLMVHTGEKPYSCWICGQSFRRKETRDTHVRYHTRERPYGCKVCDKKYISKSHLRDHVKANHESVREPKIDYCMICSKKFHSMKSLKAHVRSHLGQKPFACAFCDKSYVSRKAVSAHVRSSHAHLKNGHAQG